MSLKNFVFSKLFLKNLGLAILIALLVVAGFWFYLKSYTMHNSHVVVPNLKGKTIEETQSVLEDLDLTYLVIDSLWNRDFEGGTIMEQIPEPQSEVKRNREIYLTVYRHEPDAKKINIKEGDDQYVAKIKLTNIGVDYEIVYEANELLAGRVLRMTQNGEKLLPGSSLKPGSKVKLFVGEQRDQKVGIPNLSGLTLEQAEKLLQSSNLSLGYPFYDDVVINKEDSLSAKVYQQSPKPTAESTTKVGSSVDLWLSTEELFIEDPDQLNGDKLD